MQQINSPQPNTSTQGFFLAGELANELSVSRTHIHRLRHDGEIPKPVRDISGKIIGFPVSEIRIIAEARRQHLPKSARIEIARKLQDCREIDTTSLADEFLASIH